MIRKVDLVSYLPPFVAEYKEINAALTAENPEFKIVWEAADRVLKNEFIATADEYGISRFERILKIYPPTEDTLEIRRARIQVRWFVSLPYTWRMLIEKLVSICGENNFSITSDFMFYKVLLDINLDIYSQGFGLKNLSEELNHLLEIMMPCNMVYATEFTIRAKENATLCFGGGFGSCVRLPVPEAGDSLTAETTLHTGGTTAIRSTMSGSEDTLPPPPFSILRTGGVCTIISNLSGG